MANTSSALVTRAAPTWWPSTDLGPRRSVARQQMPSTAEFTPDGSWIAFVRYTEGQRDVWKMRPDGSEGTRLTDLATTNPGMHAQGPLSISPDGSEVAFNLIRSADNHWQIGTVPLSGGSPVQVTASSQSTAYPTWSPDGQWIAAYRQGTGLVRFRPDGSDLSALPYANGAYPAWQPASLTVRSSRSVVDAGSTLTLTMRLAWPGPENNTIQLQSHRQGDAWKNAKTLTADGFRDRSRRLSPSGRTPGSGPRGVVTVDTPVPHRRRPTLRRDSFSPRV